jgi:hypothetical protein
MTGGLPRWLAAGVLTVLLAAGAYLYQVPPRLPEPTRAEAADEPWSLEPAPGLDSSQALALITAKRIWGAPNLPPGVQPPGAGQAALTPPDWRIVGVVIRGGQRAVLIQVQGAPFPVSLAPGERLPGGAEILDISPDRLTLRLGGRRAHLSTYRP